jgi:hypothetical protein
MKLNQAPNKPQYYIARRSAESLPNYTNLPLRSYEEVPTYRIATPGIASLVGGVGMDTGIQRQASVCEEESVKRSTLTWQCVVAKRYC